MRMRGCTALAVLTLLAPAAFAQPAPVLVQNVWARATPPGATTGIIYMQLTSRSGDRLVGVSTPAAASAMLHQTVMDGGIMRMPAVTGGLALPAGTPVLLHPEGPHVMLEGLTAPLTKGEAVKVHLTFQTAPPEDVTAIVQPIGATGPADAMAGMDMGK